MYSYAKISLTTLLIGFLLSMAPPFNFVQEGEASYYADQLKGNPTASGAPYHPDSLTAAHRYLPMGTEILVTNTANQRQVSVIVNDRGPFHPDRIVDVSYRAADSLGIVDAGVGTVTIQAQLPADVVEQLQEQINASTKQ